MNKSVMLTSNLDKMLTKEASEFDHPFPLELVLSPISRRPMRLEEATIETILSRPIRVNSFRQFSRTKEEVCKSVSIIIVTFDNLVFNRLCMESLLANTDYPDYEVIVIDNGSNDGTRDYLRDLSQQNPHIRIMLNDSNRGFAPANNQGLAMAAGDVLVLLNNDTIVPRGWLTRLVKHLEEQSIGAIGPVTNRICNEAQIEVSYRTYGEFVRFAEDYTREHSDELFDIRMLAMFCMAMRRDVYELIGPIDERYKLGMLEDDDYAMRLNAAGYRVVCAEDVFIHHFGQASFSNMMDSGEYQSLREANQRRFEKKWGVCWKPHGHRLSAEYKQLTDRIHKVVSASLPPDATVLVVSKGDDELLKLEGQRGLHFPQNTDGVYAGYNPADSTEAIAALEALRVKGGDYLLFPNTSLWWLEHYAEFKQHLESRYRVIVDQKETCVIFALRESAVQPEIALC